MSFWGYPRPKLSPKQKYPNPMDNLKYPGFSTKDSEEAFEQQNMEARKLMKKK